MLYKAHTGDIIKIGIILYPITFYRLKFNYMLLYYITIILKSYIFILLLYCYCAILKVVNNYIVLEVGYMLAWDQLTLKGKRRRLSQCLNLVYDELIKSFDNIPKCDTEQEVEESRNFYLTCKSKKIEKIKGLLR